MNSLITTGLIVLLSLNGLSTLQADQREHADSASAAQPEILWDFTKSNGPEKEPLVTQNIRQEINDAVMRRGGSSDKVSIFSAAEGIFTEGGRKQKVYITWQFGQSMIDHISFFALYTNGSLTLIRNQYDGVLLRTVRVPEADVNYIVLNSSSGSNGDDLGYTRVISLRDGHTSKIIADVGITSDDFCASEAPGAAAVSSKVFYKVFGTTMEILPFDQFKHGCIKGDNFTFVRTTRDDAQHVLLAYMSANAKRSTNPMSAAISTSGPATKNDPDSLIGKPVHSGVYSYRGIEVGESRSSVMAKFRELGYRTLSDCNGLGRCTFKETPESGVSNMEVLFKQNKLEDLIFYFDITRFGGYIGATTALYGPPTSPLHSLGNDGNRAVDWKDGSVSPCKFIRIADSGPPSGPHNAVRKGIFYLQQLEALSYQGVEHNLCASND